MNPVQYVIAFKNRFEDYPSTFLLDGGLPCGVALVSGKQIKKTLEAAFGPERFRVLERQVAPLIDGSHVAIDLDGATKTTREAYHQLFEGFRRHRFDFSEGSDLTAAKIHSTSLRPLMRAIVADILVSDGTRTVFSDMRECFIRGLVPLGWFGGEWPEGFMAVCPVDERARQAIPADKVVPEGELKAALKEIGQRKKQEQAAVQARIDQQSGLVDLPEVASPGDPAPAQGDAARALFAERFAVLARTPACEGVLGQLTRLAGGLTINRGEHRWTFEGPAGSWELACGKPWLQPLVHVPASLAPILRLHNGMVWRRSDGYGEDRQFLPYRKSGFPVEWERWTDQAGAKSEDPLSWKPLAPIFDGADLYLYHPWESRSGEPAFQRFDHEIGQLAPALPYGAGGVWLRLMLGDLLGPGPASPWPSRDEVG